jgi:AraC-like DNA-binding protein/mannose-6-phosphate isomerase-like protein (cupin superfamily)
MDRLAGFEDIHWQPTIVIGNYEDEQLWISISLKSEIDIDYVGVVMVTNYQKLNLSFQRMPLSSKLVSDQIHEDYEIFFLLSGRGSITVEQNIYYLKPGDLLIINNSEIHQNFSTEEKAGGGECIEIHFAPDLLAPFSRTFNLYHCFLDRLKGKQNKIVLTKLQKEKIAKLFLKIENLFVNPFYADEILKYTALIELIFYINRLFLNFSPIEERPNLPENLSKILEYIDDNIQNELSLESLEKTFYINKSYLGRLFQKNLNVSIHEYIVLQRIAKAKELLMEGYNAQDAGRLSGFNDYSNFSKMFKKVTHISPSEYLKNQHNENINSRIPKPYRNKSNSKLPDLIVTDLLWTPFNPLVGDKVVFKALVKNIGAGSVPMGVILGVGFRVDGFTETWSDNYTLGLAPGESILLHANNGQGGIATWTAIPGSHQISAHADDIGRIEELNKDDNQMVRSLIVGEP